MSKIREKYHQWFCQFLIKNKQHIKKETFNKLLFSLPSSSIDLVLSSLFQKQKNSFMLLHEIFENEESVSLFIKNMGEEKTYQYFDQYLSSCTMNQIHILLNSYENIEDQTICSMIRNYLEEKKTDDSVSYAIAIHKFFNPEKYTFVSKEELEDLLIQNQNFDQIYDVLRLQDFVYHSKEDLKKRTYNASKLISCLFDMLEKSEEATAIQTAKLAVSVIWCAPEMVKDKNVLLFLRDVFPQVFVSEQTIYSLYKLGEDYFIDPQDEEALRNESELHKKNPLYIKALQNKTTKHSGK